jgi:tetratricopeptide (TPR) repeat protein/tRNA A-37 threonylcarbamoyl transferase component Bud32
MSDTPPLPSLSPAEARQIDQTCDRFESAWKAGQRPRPEAYLCTVGEPERSTLLRQLLLLDWDYRRQAGDDPRAGDYQARFPDDTAVIEGVCREMTEVADSTCVWSHGPQAPHTPWAGAPPSALPGEAAAGAEAGLARYDLLQEVGQGGIGVVFRGRDRVLGRELAVKVLRDAYRDDPDARRRFTEEARVGSQLQHPAIVPVYELGRFDDSRPYLTMKLVEGHTLAALLQGRADLGQDLPRWLGVFAQVCQAMAYAHARGVVHRDLKPANVMVGAFGEVQVMDWGFAKQLRMENDGGASEICNPLSAVRNGARATQSGALMGTPAYMPPEQARGESALIDARADVFALGAILCEILMGRPPYVGGTADEVCHQAAAGDLRDAHARLDACGADEALRDLAKRCLAAERVARPSDAGVVAGELTAYLASAQERLRQAQLERAAAEARAQEAAAKAKAERRARRLTLALAAAVLLLLLGVAAVPSVGYVLLRAEQEQTEKARQQTEKERRAAVAAREDEALRRRQARRALDLLTGPVIKDWLGKQVAVLPGQKQFLEQALAIYTEFAAETRTDEASRAGLAHAYHQVGTIQRRLGQRPEAEEAYNRAAELYTQLSAASPGRLDYRKELAEVLFDRARIWNAMGRVRQSEAALRDLVPLTRQLAAASTDPADRSLLAWTLAELAWVCQQRDNSRDAEAFAREAVTICKQRAAKAPGSDQVRNELSSALQIQGKVFFATGRFADAERTYRDTLKLLESLAATNPNNTGIHKGLAITHLALSEALRRTKGPREAEAAAREALKGYQQLSAVYPTSPGLRAGQAFSHELLGLLLTDLGRHADAEQAFRNAIRLFGKLSAEWPKVPAHRLGLARTHFDLGGLLRKMNRPQEAEAADREASRLLQALAAEDPEASDSRHYLAGSLVNRALMHHLRGEWAEARRLLVAALPHHQAAIKARPRVGEYRLFLCMNRFGLAQTFLKEKRHAEAAEAVEQLAAVAEAAATEANVKVPVQLMRGAAYLAWCVALAEKDVQLPDARRAELARSYAEQAVATLRLAVKHGYKDAARLKTDPDFAPVRSRPDFQELVAELEKGSKLP